MEELVKPLGAIIIDNDVVYAVQNNGDAWAHVHIYSPANGDDPASSVFLYLDTEQLKALADFFGQTSVVLRERIRDDG